MEFLVKFLVSKGLIAAKELWIDMYVLCSVDIDTRTGANEINQTIFSSPCSTHLAPHTLLHTPCSTYLASHILLHISLLYTPFLYFSLSLSFKRLIKAIHFNARLLRTDEGNVLSHVQGQELK